MIPRVQRFGHSLLICEDLVVIWPKIRLLGTHMAVLGNASERVIYICGGGRV